MRGVGSACNQPAITNLAQRKDVASTTRRYINADVCVLATFGDFYELIVQLQLLMRVVGSRSFVDHVFAGVQLNAIYRQRCRFIELSLTRGRISGEQRMFKIRDSIRD